MRTALPLFKTLLLTLAVTYGAASWSETVRFASDDWCPFTCFDKQKPGIAVELAQHIFSRAGIEFDYIHEPVWADVLADLRAGKIDLTAGLSSSDYTEIQQIGPPFANDVSCIFKQTDMEWTYKGLKSLPQIHLGIVRAYDYGDGFDEYIAKHRHSDRVNEFDDMKSLLQAFDSRKVEVIYANEYVVKYHIGLGTLRERPKEASRCNRSVSKKNGIYFGMSDPANARTQRIAEILEQGLKDSHDDGTIIKILRKYYL